MPAPRRHPRQEPPSIVLLRRLAALLCLALVAYGLWLRGGISDARWLGLLGTAWLLLLVALWPSLPESTPTFARTTIRTAVLIASVFVVLSVQLVRVQVLQAGATVARVARDPASGEVVANPRFQIADLEARRGRVFDRAGAVLADTVFEENTAHRVYPEPESAYVVGYFSPLLYGKDGLEAVYDAELAGSDGNNAVLRGLNDLLDRPPEGLDLHLTLDADLQRAAHDLLADRPGAAVLLDVETGAVLALASNPHYDSNRLFTGGPAEREDAVAYWQTLVDDPAAPLVLRATDGLFTPGSTFKVVSAAAAIDAGFADPERVYEDDGDLDVAGRVIVEQNRPDPTRDEWTLREGLAWSLNVVFAQVGLQLGPGLMRDYAAAFGFGQEIPFDLPVPVSRLESADGFLDAAPALADTAFGQGQLQATPLQMTLVAAAIANDGEVPRPRLVNRLATQDGEVVERFEPETWRRAVDAEAAAQVASMMVTAVEGGIAQAATIPGVTVGGKTGTAEVGDGDPHAWFIGFAGDPEPRYAVAVVLEHGGAGMAGSLLFGRDLLAAALAE
ncbi:MAG: penicillin-binding protein 2 [Chloroflexota bacterium]|nr:penicillin-binding protein 2 [Chloroflexota bacterium]